jgi:hypothetical protein
MNQGPTLQGDFLSVAIIDGHAEMSFNLGETTQPIRITSEVTIINTRRMLRYAPRFHGNFL